ncbi:MAG: DUF3459 domain-containing protein, partial [Planctomycetota bacterium]|nr:DUF3459 domain-containing protein [Planctomycetota bacterium]
ADLAAAFEHGFVYEGQHSLYRGRRHGRPARDVPSKRFIVFAQNHDQVGNRAQGDRLSTAASFDRLKLAAASVLLSPFVPMLFMGEEYADPAPFLYFVDHSDPDLIEAVREGRKREFASFGWSETPPDPQSPDSLARSRLDHTLIEQPQHRVMHELTRELLRLRRDHPALRDLNKDRLIAVPNERSRTLLVLRGPVEGRQTALLLSFADSLPRTSIQLPEGDWRTILDSHDDRWRGAGRVAADRFSSRGVAEIDMPSPGFLLLERETP